VSVKVVRCPGSLAEPRTYSVFRKTGLCPTCQKRQRMICGRLVPHDWIVPVAKEDNKEQS
jgi:hypothetical protein